MKKVVVSGSQGFIGRTLVRHLIHAQYDVIPIKSTEIDLTQSQSVQQLMAFKADFIFHLAGRVGIMPSWNDPLRFYEANVNTTVHMLEYARLMAIPLHYVSAYVYGNQIQQPISESAIPLPNNPYAHSKVIAEGLCQFYNRSFLVPITISRPFNIYGKDQSKDFFIPSVVDQISNSDQITIHDCSPKRDYIYIDDVADALICIMERGKAGSIYNIGTGISHSCGDLISILQSILKTSKKINITHIKRPNEVFDACADITKIQTEIKWSPKYTLEEGLKIYVNN